MSKEQRRSIEGGILVHKHDKLDWRLRKFRDKKDNHPLDPNWETGRYIRCHHDAREKMKSGTTIFDIVIVKGKGVIRSAFLINRVVKRGSERILYFKKFWYPASSTKPINSPYHIIRTRYAKKLDEGEVKSLVDKMRKAGYVEYTRGMIPRNIESEDWKAMIREGRKALGRPHQCP